MEVKEQSVKAFKSGFFTIFFCFLFSISNITQAAEGVNVALPGKPIVVSGKPAVPEKAQPTGEAVQVPEQAVSPEKQVSGPPPSEAQIPSVKEELGKMESAQPSEGVTEENIPKRVSKKHLIFQFFQVLGYVLLFLVILVILRIILNLLKKPAQPTITIEKPVLQKQEHVKPSKPVKEENKQIGISEAVASFVKHRLKK